MTSEEVPKASSRFILEDKNRVGEVVYCVGTISHAAVAGAGVKGDCSGVVVPP